jgi:hypothetical protein
MRLLFLSLLVLSVPVLARTSVGDGNPVQIRGHYIGEPISRFLRLEADAREELEVCRERSGRSACARLVAAVDHGERTEISTLTPVDWRDPDRARDSIDFVLDGGKLVKLTMLVNDVSDVAKWFGSPSSESTVSSQNRSGQKWDDHLSVWNTADLYVTLYQDNNPSLQDRRPTLIVETPTEHARDAASTATRTTTPQ